MVDRQQSFKGVRDAREAVLRRSKKARRIRKQRNTPISRIAAGTRAMVDDLVLVEEVHAVWTTEAVHLKLAHE